MSQNFGKLLVGASMVISMGVLATTPAQAVTFTYNNTNEIRTYTGGSNGIYVNNDTTAATKALTDSDVTSNVELWYSTENPNSNVDFTATQGKYSATVSSVTASDWSKFSSQWLGDLLTAYKPFESVWNGFSANSKSLVTSYLPSLGMGDPNIGNFAFGQNGGVELKLVGHLDVKSKLATTISSQVTTNNTLLQSAKTQITTLQAQLPTSTQITTLQGQFPTTTQISTLQANLTNVQNLSVPANSVQALKDALAAVKGAVPTTTQLSSIGNLQTTLASLGSSLPQLQNGLLAVANFSANTDINTIQALKDQLPTQITQLETLNTQIGNLLTLNTQLTTFSSKIDTLNNQLTTAIQSLSAGSTKNQLIAIQTNLINVKTQLPKVPTIPTSITQLSSQGSKLTTLSNQLPSIDQFTSFKDLLTLQNTLNGYQGEIAASEIAKVVTGGQTYYAYNFNTTASGITASDDQKSYTAIYTWNTPGYVAAKVPEPSAIFGLLGVVSIFAAKRKFKKASV